MDSAWELYIKKMEEAARMFELLQENAYALADPKSAYYGIGEAAFSAWESDPQDLFKITLKNRLVQLVADQLLWDMQTLYEDCKHSQKRPTFEKFAKSIYRGFCIDHAKNRLVSCALKNTEQFTLIRRQILPSEARDDQEKMNDS